MMSEPSASRSRTTSRHMIEKAEGLFSMFAPAGVGPLISAFMSAAFLLPYSIWMRGSTALKMMSDNSVPTSVARPEIMTSAVTTL